VRNLYRVRFINKRNQTATVSIRLGRESPAGYQLSGSGQTFTVGALGEMTRTCVVVATANDYIGPSDVIIETHANPGDVTLRKTVGFLGPNPETFKPTQP
jgi:hypothetical protein